MNIIIIIDDDYAAADDDDNNHHHLHFQISDVQGSGTISIHPLSFNNTQGVDINGKCCDGPTAHNPPCGTDLCDHVFTFCVSDSNR